MIATVLTSQTISLICKAYEVEISKGWDLQGVTKADWREKARLSHETHAYRDISL